MHLHLYTRDELEHGKAVLQTASKAINEGGWTRAFFETGSGRSCVLGGIDRALRKLYGVYAKEGSVHSQGASPVTRYQAVAVFALGSVVKSEWISFRNVQADIMLWNDTKTFFGKRRVLAGLDAAIKLVDEAIAAKPAADPLEAIPVMEREPEIRELVG